MSYKQTRELAAWLIDIAHLFASHVDPLTHQGIASYKVVGKERELLAAVNHSQDLFLEVEKRGMVRRTITLKDPIEMEVLGEYLREEAA